MTAPHAGPAHGADAAPGLHLPALAAALLIMLIGTLYPPLLVDATGHMHHGMTTAVCWAMSAGFVRGVGFVPRWPLWRWLLSGWSCIAALALAALWRAVA
jgi:predicted membrane protein